MSRNLADLTDFERSYLGVTPKDIEQAHDAEMAMRRAIGGVSLAAYRLSKSAEWETLIKFLDGATDKQHPATVNPQELIHQNAQRVLYKELLRLVEQGKGLANERPVDTETGV